MVQDYRSNGNESNPEVDQFSVYLIMPTKQVVRASAERVKRLSVGAICTNSGADFQRFYDPDFNTLDDVVTKAGTLSGRLQRLRLAIGVGGSTTDFILPR